ncbi:hypothetical protein [Enterococcus saccharolyticus]|uniref:Uncharacterized protein n=1 Tax=Enterococcus saccharolyticus subsp. saccharolyticus ATCC 43076 TaxID=1139996 RepID=S0N8D0_9ENTE|nr:hypothetical protein [Enterococcus saccharolyticus]EOT28091.1 hypothetical protein OMQ_02006 [Enterococcus saccharolyticus subsp. saccharolyticus ATCC 43076]EOT77469.1 hypothetical protein I572_02382 [Enterococcus saccharolyticus subsp. saccharolyticus ATCC 43076]
MYENFKTKVTLKKLSNELRLNTYWGSFPDTETFTSDLLGKYVTPEELPSFLQTLDICENGTQLCFTHTETNITKDDWRSKDYYFTIESNFEDFKQLLTEIVKSQSTDGTKCNLQTLLNQEVTFVAEAENNTIQSLLQMTVLNPTAVLTKYL